MSYNDADGAIALFLIAGVSWLRNQRQGHHPR